MRSRPTNFLQAVVLLSAVVYLIIGIIFFISPLSVLSFFAENVSENWLDLVMDNELVAPLYFASRGFSALLITSGMAMVMPLFDPLKYRGLIYFNGLIFTLLSSILFMKNGLFLSFFRDKTAGGLPVATEREGHLIVIVLGIIFTFLFVMYAIALIITRKQSKEGLE